jgi:hypothetical protein
MQKAAASSTASLDVTELANSAWASRQEAAADQSLRVSTSLLISDIIRLDGGQMSQVDFDAISFVMDQAMDHTERYCRERRVRIAAFRSVEVLRFILPEDAMSFLFLFEPDAAA